jgi:predicted  nucleic acid-binding Zn-ribbon protein
MAKTIRTSGTTNNISWTTWAVLSMAVLLLALLAASTRIRSEAFAGVAPGLAVNSTGEAVLLNGIQEGNPCVIRGILMPPHFREPSRTVKGNDPNMEACVIETTIPGVLDACTTSQKTLLHDPYVTQSVAVISTDNLSSPQGSERKCLVRYNNMATRDQLIKYVLENDVKQQMQLLDDANQMLTLLTKSLEQRAKDFAIMYEKVTKANDQERAALQSTLAALQSDMESQRQMIRNLTDSRTSLQHEVDRANATNVATRAAVASLQSTMNDIMSQIQRQVEANVAAAANAAAEQATLTAQIADARTSLTKQQQNAAALRSQIDQDRMRFNHALAALNDKLQQRQWTAAYFYPRNQSIRSALRSDLCLEHRYDGANEVTTRRCTGATNQQFNMDQAQRVKSTSSGRCLDVYASSVDANARVVTWDCNDRDSQKWIMDTEGRLHPKHSQYKCLEVLSGNPNDGGSLVINDCRNSVASQKWSVV